MKRLSDTQKREAVIQILCRTPFSMSTTAIAKEIGYQTNAPINAAVNALCDLGWLEFYEEAANTGTVGRYWRLTPEGRRECRKHGYL